MNWVDPFGLETMVLPGPFPLPIILPKTPAQQEADRQLAEAFHDAWMDYVHPPLIAAGDLLYGGGIGDWLYDMIHDDSASCSLADSDAGRKKQGREIHEKKRKKNWSDNSNRRTPPKKRRHTPGRGHRKKSKP